MAQEPKTKSGVLLLSSRVVPHHSPASGLTITPIELNIESIKFDVPLYILQNGSSTSIVEIMHFGPAYGSWMFVPKDEEESPEIAQNGAMSFVTVVDPLFLALALLQKSKTGRQSNMFQPLDNIVTEVSGVDLRKLCSEEQLKLLCETTNCSNETYYKLDDRKTLLWLQHKLKSAKSRMNCTHADALELVAQYLSQPWKENFLKRFKEDDEKKSTDDIIDITSDATEAEKAAQEMALSVILNGAKEHREIPNVEKQTEQKTGNSNSSNKKRKAPPKPKAAGANIKNVRLMTSYFGKKSG